MQLSNIPGKLLLPFANAGGKSIIPVASQIGITAGAASLTDGFPPLTRTPIAAGGVPPSGLDMNGILYEMSAIVRWANAGGGYPYDGTFATDTNVGGYPKGARIMRSDGQGYWFNTAENNTTDPEAAGAAAAGWVPDYQAGATTVAMSGSSVTLSPAQYGKPLIIITGTLTANINLIFPALAQCWTVVNTTTGGYSITAKTTGGSGVPLGSDFIGRIVNDGVDIYAENLSFLQSLAGAVPRNMNTKVGELVSLSDFGDVFTSAGTASAAFTATMSAIGNVGLVVNPKGSLFDVTSVTLPNAVCIIDMQNQKIIASEVAVGKSLAAGGGHLLLKDVRNNQATRIHVEPRGFPVGVAAKFDLMFDDYESDLTNYRIVNLYTKTYDPADTSTTQGNNGVAVLGTKGVGRNFGIWPTLHFGFSDDGAGAAVPMKMYYFDTSDTVWRTPMRGAWRQGFAATSGDYMLSANNLYQAASTGTTGATPPTHSAGTVSDGGVNWAFVRDYGAVSGNVKGCMVFGDRDDLPKFGNPGVRSQFAKDSAFWNGVNLTFFDNTGAAKWNIYQILNGTDLYIASADGTKKLRFGQNGFFQLIGMPMATDTKGETSGASSVSVSGVSELVCGNTGPTTINEFTGMVPGQVFWVSAANGQTTLQGSASIRLKGGAASYTMATNDVLMFKVNSAGTIAQECGR